MSKRSVIAETATIGKVTASPGCSMKISITWSSVGGVSFGVYRQLTSELAVRGHAIKTIVPPKTKPIRSSATDVVPDSQAYTYTVIVWDSSNVPVSRNSNSVTGNPATCILPASGFFTQSKVDGSYMFLLAQGSRILYYRHKKGSILTGHWEHVHTLNAPGGGTIPGNAVSLIESTAGNLAAVAVVTPPGDGPNYLASYELVSGTGWQKPVILKANGQTITGALGIPAFIQARDGSYQLFVSQGRLIGRYIHPEGSLQDGTWMSLPPFGPSETGTYTAVSALQTASDQLELIARVTPAFSPEPGVISDYLETFVARSVDPNYPPDHVGPLLADGQQIMGVTGGASFMEKDGGVFELIVPTGDSMSQHIRETASTDTNLWKHVSTLKQLPNEPGIQFTATSLIESDSEKLALVAIATPPQGEGNAFPVTYELTGWKGPRRITVDSTSSDEDHDRDRQERD